MNSKYIELRNKYEEFRYNSFNIEEIENDLVITYDFEIVGLTHFNPKWVLKRPQDFSFAKQKEIIENLVFNLGMVEIVSYLKCVYSKKLIVACKGLTDEQKLWWKKLYINGLGEFFYVNNIAEEMNIDTFLEIECEKPVDLKNYALNYSLDGNLIPIGGGKDSLVTLDALKVQKDKNTCYVVNSRGATKDSILASGYNENSTYEAKRYLDQRLIDLNKQGFLNGHTPFSAILAFSSYIVAVMMKKKYIVLSNEASANESNVEGTNINHQYSKSTEFEKDFREYSQKYLINNGPEYFSLLRPLTEWQIVCAFAKLDKYFKVFKSCNVGSKTDIWCEKCPKCLYVYLMLNGFLKEEQMKEIFNTNMLEDEENIALFEGLIYPDKDKPFECVGTKEEINLCINMAIERLEKENKDLPYLYKKYKGRIENLEEELEKAKQHWNEDNFLPIEFEKILKSYIGGNIETEN